MRWSTDEDITMTEQFPMRGARRMMDLLPGRDERSINRRARVLKLQVRPEVKKANIRRAKDSSTERSRRANAAIQEYYWDHGAKYVADLIGESRPYVVQRAYALGCTVDPEVKADLLSQGAYRSTKDRPVKKSKYTTRQYMENSMGDVERLALYGRRVDSLVGSGELL